MNDRIVSLNYLRIMGCIMVIGIHLLWCLSELKSSGVRIIYILIEHVVRIGLPVFFLLSAVSLVGKKDFLTDIKSYYLKKVLNIFFPFLIWSSIYYQLNSGSLGIMGFSIKEFFKGIYKSFFVSQYAHLWYMYAFIGLVLLMPFLKRMLDHLNYKEIVILCGIILSVLTLKEYLKVKIDEFYFGTWISFYIFGAFVFKEETKRFYLALSLMGGVAFALSVIAEYRNPESVFMILHWEYSPLMILQVLGLTSLFLWIERYMKFPGVKVSEVLSKLTYRVYLVHPFIIHILPQIPILKGAFSDKYGPMWTFGMIYVETVVGSFLLSAVIETIMYILKNNMMKVRSRYFE